MTSPAVSLWDEVPKLKHFCYKPPTGRWFPQTFLSLLGAGEGKASVRNCGKSTALLDE